MGINYAFCQLTEIKRKRKCVYCKKLIKKESKALKIMFDGAPYVAYEYSCLECGKNKLDILIKALKKTRKEIIKPDLVMEAI